MGLQDAYVTTAQPYGYLRTDTFDELALARADGTYARVLMRLARVDVLILDDWGMTPLGPGERRDMSELMEDRCGERSTILTSQRSPELWHDHIGDPTIADAICDRILSNCHRIVLKGPSRRKHARVAPLRPSGGVHDGRPWCSR